jgi:hypothetical protein
MLPAVHENDSLIQLPALTLLSLTATYQGHGQMATKLLKQAIETGKRLQLLMNSATSTNLPIPPSPEGRAACHVAWGLFSQATYVQTSLGLGHTRLTSLQDIFPTFPAMRTRRNICTNPADPYRQLRPRSCDEENCRQFTKPHGAHIPAFMQLMRHYTRHGSQVLLSELVATAGCCLCGGLVPKVFELGP